MPGKSAEKRAACIARTCGHCAKLNATAQDVRRTGAHGAPYATCTHLTGRINIVADVGHVDVVAHQLETPGARGGKIVLGERKGARKYSWCNAGETDLYRLTVDTTLVHSLRILHNPPDK